MENDEDDADSSILSRLLLVLVLTLVNAFFAMSELAVIAANKAKIKNLADEGNKRAKLVQKLKDNETRFLSTIQVGITLAGFFSSATAAVGLSDKLASVLASWNIPYAASISLVLITIVLSLFTLIFGELFPKRIALANPEKVSMAVAYPIAAVKFLATPFALFLTGACNLLAKITRLNKNDDAKVTADEIKYMVKNSVSDGTLDIEKQKMIESVLKFNDLTGTDIMTPRTNTYMIDVEDKLEDYLKELMEMKYSRIPVFKESRDNIIGILNTKELFQKIIENGNNDIDINSILRKPLFVQDKIKIDDLFEKMKIEKAQMVVLLDEFGGVSGIVTMEDVVEEVVGNIYDEFDDEVSIRKTSDTEYIIEGTTPIQEVNRETGLELDEENPDYDTISGLLITSLDRFPKTGDYLTIPMASTVFDIPIESITLTVIETNKLQIKKVKLQISYKEQEEKGEENE